MSLPTTPSADEITVKWLMDNKHVVAEYMAIIRALANLEVVVSKNGERTRHPVSLSAANSIIEIEV